MPTITEEEIKNIHLEKDVVQFGPVNKQTREALQLHKILKLADQFNQEYAKRKELVRNKGLFFISSS